MMDNSCCSLSQTQLPWPFPGNPKLIKEASRQPSAFSLSPHLQLQVPSLISSSGADELLWPVLRPCPTSQGPKQIQVVPSAFLPPVDTLNDKPILPIWRNRFSTSTP